MEIYGWWRYSILIKPDYVVDNSNLPVWQSAGHCPKPWLESYGVEEGEESYKSPVISLTPRPPRSSLTQSQVRPMEIGRKVWWNVNQISLMNWVELDCRISSDSRDGGLEEMKKTVVAGGFICLSQSQPARPLITNNYQSKQQISTRGGNTTHKNTRTQRRTESVQTLSW